MVNPAANFCRNCGFPLRSYDPEITSATTRPIANQNISFFPKTGSRVIPLGFEDCKVRVVLYVEWLSEDTNLEAIPLDDEWVRSEVEVYQNHPKNYDVESIPLDEIGANFCNAFLGYFSGWTRKGDENYIHGKAGGLFKDWANVSKDFVYIKKPEVRKGHGIHDELPIFVHNYWITFEVSFGYHLIDFHKDTKLIIEKVTEVIKGLYDWSYFQEWISCSFRTSESYKL
jgi:hypothetical protein